jgi:hypothetical protein
MLGDTDCRLTSAKLVLSNLSTGESSDPSNFLSSGVNFKVGDRWQLNTIGCVPGADVGMTSHFRDIPSYWTGQKDLSSSILLGGYRDGNTPIGKTGSDGSFSIGGVFTDEQAGSWFLTLNLGGQLTNQLYFNVYASDGSLPTHEDQVTTGTPLYLQATPHIPANASQYTPQTLAQMAVVPTTPASGSVPANTTAKNTVANTGVTPVTGNTQLPILNTISSDVTSIIPGGWVGVLIGGVVLLLLFKGGK